MDNLEYVPEVHRYLYKGKTIPSATQIVAWRYPKTYDKIPSYVLKKAADYGTLVHETIEKVNAKAITDEEVHDLGPEVRRAVKDYELLMKKACMFPESFEQMICWKGRYAGTYDILTKDNVLIDIKTTSKIHVDNETKEAPLNLQLSLYAMALGVKEAWYLHLPKKGKASIGKVELWDEKDLVKLIEEYEKEFEPL